MCDYLRSGGGNGLIGWVDLVIFLVFGIRCVEDGGWGVFSWHCDLYVGCNCY